MMLRPSCFGLDSTVPYSSTSLQQFHATNRAGDLTTAQHDGDLDLVASVKEAGHMALLHVEIVVVNLQAETNLLDFRGALVAASFTSLDLLVVLVLAVIDELGNRRLRVGRHLDEIEVRFLCQVQCDGSRDDSHLFAVRADQTHLGDANLVVNAWFVADDDSNPHVPFDGMLPDRQFFKVSHVHGKPKHPIRGRNKEPYHSSSTAVSYGTRGLCLNPRP